ncbi:MAG: hypothetical protein FGM61_10820 [Sediminibacterium sp.]|nr:hypothetical protein [Sediminibacterium sp.]
MKNLSLKMDDSIYQETERITNRLRKARNRYINEAVDLYNQFNRRKLLQKQLAKESALTAQDSMEVLALFEKFIDGK